MIMTNGNLGEFINGFFEELMMWELDSPIITLTGRDIAVFLLGFLVCWILIVAFEGKEKDNGFKHGRQD